MERKHYNTSKYIGSLEEKTNSFLILNEGIRTIFTLQKRKEIKLENWDKTAQG